MFVTVSLMRLLERVISHVRWPFWCSIFTECLLQYVYIFISQMSSSSDFKQWSLRLVWRQSLQQEHDAFLDHFLIPKTCLLSACRILSSILSIFLIDSLLSGINTLKLTVIMCIHALCTMLLLFLYLQLSSKLPASFAVSVDYVAKAVVISVTVDAGIWVL